MTAVEAAAAAAITSTESATPGPVLTTVSATHALSVGNRVVNHALISAIGAVFLLNDMGVCVIDVSIRSGRAVLRIDRPPPEIEGAVSVSRPIGILREEIRVAPFHSCQLEWSGRVASRVNVLPLARSGS